MKWQILQGDVREQLATLDAESVQCAVTSPPYWGLRDYGTGTWEGGDAECDHVEQRLACGKNTTSTLKNDGRKKETTGHCDSEYHAYTKQYRDTCGKCGAVRIDSQLGLEPTPEEYVASMVAVFREVRRVLREDGTLWLNLGDSYAGGGGFSPNAPSNLAGSKQTTQGGAKPGGIKPQGDIKAKDLVGIPWRVAFALQADGWYLRSDIIWAKPNPMPESVTDRPTKAHEYLFLLTKSARYYYDADAIREGAIPQRRTGRASHQCPSNTALAATGKRHGAAGLNGPSGDSRNKRSVWTIPTQPFPGAHFAVFPPALVEPCVKAGSKPGDLVLDPFAGSGTTLLVANRLGRDAVGCELNPEYVAMARKRLAGDMPLFSEEAEAQREQGDA